MRIAEINNCIAYNRLINFTSTATLVEKGTYPISKAVSDIAAKLAKNLENTERLFEDIPFYPIKNDYHRCISIERAELGKPAYLTGIMDEKVTFTVSGGEKELNCHIMEYNHKAILDDREFQIYVLNQSAKGHMNEVKDVPYMYKLNDMADETYTKFDELY